MKEPRRLLDGDADEFERALLASSETDVPPARAYQRTLASIGVGVMLPLSATAVAQGAGVATLAPAAKLGVLALGKWLAAGAAAGAITASGAHLTTRASAPPPPETAIVSVAPQRNGARESAPPASAPVTAAPLSSAPREEPPVVRRPLQPSKAEPPAPPALGSNSSFPPPEPPVAASPALAPERSIEGEVRAIEAARGELGRGAARAALLTLQGYYREFPRGALRPEARVLEVSALLQAGEPARARELGRDIVARDPRGAHAEAVRALLPELEKP